MKNEIRKWIAMYLLKWLIDILPEGKFKEKYILFIRANINDL